MGGSHERVEQRRWDDIEETWDAVVITTVWFDNPYFPHVQGLEDNRAKSNIR